MDDDAALYHCVVFGHASLDNRPIHKKLSPEIARGVLFRTGQAARTGAADNIFIQGAVEQNT